MSSKEESESRPTCSDPKPIPKEPTLTINNTAQCASFVSQRSSSIDTFGSDSTTDGAIDCFAETKTQDEKVTGADASPSAEGEGNRSLADTESEGVCSEGDAKPRQWLYNNEAMPASMLHPNHRSTPVKNSQYLATGGLRGTESVSTIEAEEDDRGEEDGGDKRRREVFLPGDLHTPITGYETMEARSKFTVYKIHVHKNPSEAEEEPTGWFIFRRYSDFLHLNERLKHLFPGFRLSLPPKRWFRDNFDTNFLEDRMLGLQAFLDNITGHKEICNSEAVRAFFCTDEPPGPHDSLEESRALCDTLEESIYTLRQELQDKDGELALLKEEVALYKSQVEILSKQLKAVTGTAPSLPQWKGGATSPTAVSSSSNLSSVAEGEVLRPHTPSSEEGKTEAQEVQDSE